MPRGMTWTLKHADWPAPDRRAWSLAFQGGDWLDGAGPGGHLSEKTREGYESAYGHWLAWLFDVALLDPNEPPGVRATLERLYAYASWMRPRVAANTVRMRIERLRAVLDLIDPRFDRALFARVLDRLPQHPSRDKRRQLRDPVELIAVGEALMSKSEAGGFGPSRYNAVGFRDGLMIGFAAWRPLRRRNLAGLRLGVHIAVEADPIRIVISAEETKQGAPINMTWPVELVPVLKRYLSHWRPILLGDKPDAGHLWLSRRGGRLSPHTVACNFRRHTEDALGVAISPHRFRDAAATMMSIRNPENVRASAAVLGHRSYKTTQKHYILAQQLDAISTLQSQVEMLRGDNEEAQANVFDPSV